jgi:hypothetical protein
MATKKKATRKAKASVKKTRAKNKNWKPLHYGRRGRCTAVDAKGERCAGPGKHDGSHLDINGRWAHKPVTEPNPFDDPKDTVEKAALGVLRSQPPPTSGTKHSRRTTVLTHTTNDITRLDFIKRVVEKKLNMAFSSTEQAVTTLLDRLALTEAGENPFDEGLHLGATWLKEKLGIRADRTLYVRVPRGGDYSGMELELDDTDMLLHTKPKRSW